MGLGGGAAVLPAELGVRTPSGEQGQWREREAGTEAGSPDQVMWVSPDQGVTAVSERRRPPACRGDLLVRLPRKRAKCNSSQADPIAHATCSWVPVHKQWALRSPRGAPQHSCAEATNAHIAPLYRKYKTAFLWKHLVELSLDSPRPSPVVRITATWPNPWGSRDGRRCCGITGLVVPWRGQTGSRHPTREDTRSPRAALGKPVKAVSPALCLRLLPEPRGRQQEPLPTGRELSFHRSRSSLTHTAPRLGVAEASRGARSHRAASPAHPAGSTPALW